MPTPSLILRIWVLLGILWSINMLNPTIYIYSMYDDIPMHEFIATIQLPSGIRVLTFNKNE